MRDDAIAHAQVEKPVETSIFNWFLIWKLKQR